MVVSVHDVAAYILKKMGPLTTWKLQKLVYYSQAWSLVWDEKPLFRARIEAWANGPVCPELYARHRQKFQVSDWPYGDNAKLDRVQRETVDAVLKFYGKKPPQWLSDLTHRERPWRDARGSLAPGEKSNAEITPQAMQSYYSSLRG